MITCRSLIINQVEGQDFWRKTLTDFNWQVQEAPDIPSGLALAHDLRPQLIVAGLPLKNGCLPKFEREVRAIQQLYNTSIVYAPDETRSNCYLLLCGKLDEDCEMVVLRDNVYMACHQSEILIHGFIKKLTEKLKLDHDAYQEGNFKASLVRAAPALLNEQEAVIITGAAEVAPVLDTQPRQYRSFVFNKKAGIAIVDGKERADIRLGNLDLYAFFVANLNRLVSAEEISDHLVDIKIYKHRPDVELVSRRVERLRLLLEPKSKQYQWLIARHRGWILRDEI